MLDAVRDIRIEDPGIGCYKLWIMLTVLFGAGFMTEDCVELPLLKLIRQIFQNLTPEAAVFIAVVQIF